MLDVQLALVKGSRPQRFPMRRPVAVVGRKKGCDLRIPSSEVSRRHCVFRIEYDCVTIEDLGSSNGTYLNEDRVDVKQVVRPGDHVRIGSIVFVAEYHLSQEAMERLAVRDVEPIDEEADVELVGNMAKAVPIDDVEVIEDSVDDEAMPIAVESSERIAARFRTDEDEDDMPSSSDGAGAEVIEDWQPPAGTEGNGLFDGLGQSTDKKKKK
jgi:pSer/pThr/pTyr-binding forkhead associated (FHA) protein